MNANANLAVFQSVPKALPFEVKLLEQHPHSTHVFLPMKCARFLVCVAPTLEGGAPDQNGFKAFFCVAGQGFANKPGVWHQPILALDQTAEFAMLAYEDGSAGDWVDSVLARPLLVTTAECFFAAAFIDARSSGSTRACGDDARLGLLRAPPELIAALDGIEVDFTLRCTAPGHFRCKRPHELHVAEVAERRPIVRGGSTAERLSRLASSRHFRAEITPIQALISIWSCTPARQRDVLGWRRALLGWGSMARFPAALTVRTRLWFSSMTVASQRMI